MATKKRAKKPATRKPGRPSKRTPEVERIVLEALRGQPVIKWACAKARISVDQWAEWVRTDKDLESRYQASLDVGFHALSEECLEIADTPKKGVIEKVGPLGTEIRCEDMLGHRKLQIETRLKLLAVWKPSKYGPSLKHMGDADNPVHVAGVVLVPAKGS